jgi:hypothetical protein
MDAIVPPDQKMPPTRKQLYDYGTSSRYAENPEYIYRDIERGGYVSDRAMKALETLYPAQLRILRAQLFDSLTDLKSQGKSLKPHQIQPVQKLLGIPSGEMTPEQTTTLQKSFQETPRGGGMGGRTMVDLEQGQ